MFNKFFFKNCGVCEIILKNTAEPDRPQMAICTYNMTQKRCDLHAA
jgi:hypothetical protein